MFEDIKSFFWFLVRGPKFYSTLLIQIYTKFRKSRDSDIHMKFATDWCEKNQISADKCLSNLGIPENELNTEAAFDDVYQFKINEVIDKSQSNFGGPGHVDLIYTICERLKIKNAIETGVAYGWSSAAILRSLSKRNGRLISVDMPMLKQSDYHLIGVAVESELQPYWELRREPDRFALPRAMKKMNGSLEFVHYDSDKSYYGRKWSQEIIWKNLIRGGIFVSDDIEDNEAFMEFVALHKLRFNIVKCDGKFVGVIKKEV